jgi:hypothetical protein
MSGRATTIALLVGLSVCLPLGGWAHPIAGVKLPIWPTAVKERDVPRSDILVLMNAHVRRID